MTKIERILLWAVVGVVAVSGAVAVFYKNPQVGGDFPGGIVPNQLWTASAANNSVSPILANIYTTGALSAGGTSQYNQLAVYATASTTPSSVVTLGPLGTTTSSATTTASFLVGGLSIGDICSGGAATSTVFVSGCVITAVSGGNATATVAYTNITNASLSVPTSTILRVSADHLPY